MVSRLRVVAVLLVALGVAGCGGKTAPSTASGPPPKVAIVPQQLVDGRGPRMTREDHQQAVTAMATMIASWWHHHQHDPDP
jgi:hypothetical protein